ncbi:MAG TPA: efflux RND transporter periplasmic adaptor subunit [Bacteroidales bacterium]|jgi:RND family efflux transporter MFP subunit|nr:efflux RND transporter periplasmic adaptor subunit [Bacteroidales bacterium]OQB62306.1 MAG: Multidrug resistance protein MdtA precursor [Bacteroidetes bacterium ADurb.Bin145]NMD02422.1 efflux RND transporter periplasmic adaptor subunit [Bacteroidales bacterium]HOU02540.1 efflux RND transporter periplasmic adaptor subunit [Bacteroidales bacterium]HQG64109.1 efflux RND transporter periplasmic adaptor subunit [Bacteroidales bacterium]
MKNLVLAVVLALALASCRNQDQNLTADVEIPVSVQDISLKPIEEFINTTGTAFPKGQIELKSKISANYYLEINPQTGKPWKMGDKVRTGDLIARLEDREYVIGVKLETTQLNLELAESELKKQESLYEKGGVTLKELKTASIEYENAKTNLESAKLQMAKTRIISPINGVIVDLPYYTPGTQIETGSSIAKIMDYQTMYMEVQLPEKYISVIKPGQDVRLTNYTIPEDTVMGHVTQLSPAIDADSRTFKGNVEISNTNYLLRPGMFVKADIVTNRKDSVIVIPKNIILSRQRGKTVFIVQRGLAEERIIETGLENLTDVEVTRGLMKNDRVVISGYETLSNRSKVKIVM